MSSALEFDEALDEIGMYLDAVISDVDRSLINRLKRHGTVYLSMNEYDEYPSKTHSTGSLCWDVVWQKCVLLHFVVAKPYWGIYGRVVYAHVEDNPKAQFGASATSLQHSFRKTRHS